MSQESTKSELAKHGTSVYMYCVSVLLRDGAVHRYKNLSFTQLQARLALHGTTILSVVFADQIFSEIAPDIV